MNIIEELHSAHVSFAQDEWDKALIKEWRTRNPVTATMVLRFMGKNKISKEVFYSLKRVPLFEFQQKTRISRFIAAYIPELSDLLWNEKFSDEQILQLMKIMKTQVRPSDNDKVMKEKYERTKANKEANAENASHYLVKLQREHTAKSNWKHCK